MTLLRTVTVLAAMFLLAGCLPVTTTSPAGTTTGLNNDPALYGTWKGKNPDDPKQRDAFFHFMLAKNGGFDIAMAEGGSDDGWTAFTARTAKLGPHRILNMVMTYDKNAPVEGSLKGANIPVLYTVKGQTLTLYRLDENAIKAAIKSGQITGTAGQGDSGDAVITASPDKLDAFLARPEAAKLFNVMLVLTKAD